MHFDSLERRTLFAAGIHHHILVEQGTSTADVISFEKSGDQLIVRTQYRDYAAYANDTAGASLDKQGRSKFVQTQTFNLADFRSIEVDAAGGNDTVIMGKLFIPCLINGANGNDTLAGGSSADTIVGGAGDDVLNGNAGNDQLYGSAGDDILNDGTGNNTLNGGGGFDRQAVVEGFDTDNIDLENPGTRPDYLLIEDSRPVYTGASAFRESDAADVQIDAGFLFGSSGYKVDWTDPQRVINQFSVNATVTSFTGASAAVITPVTRTYDLGKLGNGTYTFTATSGRYQLGKITFTISPGWRGSRLNNSYPKD